VSVLIVSVASLIPALESRLQLKKAKPGDRSGDHEARHRKWSHLDLLLWSSGRRAASSPPNLPYISFLGGFKVRLSPSLGKTNRRIFSKMF
jgi:hypothetical protein